MLLFLNLTQTDIRSVDIRRQGSQPVYKYELEDVKIVEDRLNIIKCIFFP